MAESKDCHACGAPYQSKFENCVYCGEPIRSERVLSSSDEERIYWLLKILDTRVWRASFDYRFSIFQKYIYFFFGLGLTTFFMFVYLSENFVTSICFSFIILFNPIYSLYNEFKNYVDSVALSSYYNEKIKIILNQFMEGYNHSLGDIEYVMWKNEGLPFIKKCMIEKGRTGDVSTGLTVVAEHLLEIFDLSCYHQSMKKTSYFFIFSGLGLFFFSTTILLISKQFFHQTVSYANYACLIICLGLSIALFLEQRDTLNFTFHVFGYKPNYKLMREKWDLVKFYFTLTNFNEDDFKNLLDKNSRYVRLSIYLSEENFYSRPKHN